ncbi:hypothetical protein B566_EDAN018513, partial [Ephemera danica]
MTRVFNFSAGPAALPEVVLKQAAAEMLDWNGSGMSVMEMSHRGKEFISIHAQAESLLRELLAIPANYKVLFMQGGAIGENAIVPMNLLGGAKSIDFIHTGEWSKKSIKEAQRYAKVNVAASAEASGFTSIPQRASWQLDPQAAYVHICSNETIGGVEYHFTPEVGAVPLVADMSSNILSRPMDVSRYGLIYGGAQKNIGPAGLTIVIRFPAERYQVGKDAAPADAILLRSADMHAMALPPELLAVARAGAGTNNIPVAALSARGVPVFNAPGANANAVKELVLAGMLMAARNLKPALRFVAELKPQADMERTVEEGKKAFAGFELTGKTLGVIGLGRIGCSVADAAIKLGMDVLGFDPDITVDAAWSLPASVRRASSVNELMRQCQFVSLHVPLVTATRQLVNVANLSLMPAGSVVLNFSREGVVDDNAALAALESGRLAWYVSDFPSAELLVHERVLALPHLGASTQEAEENCAVMVADQLRDYLEHGNVAHAVNFPAVSMGRESPWRVAIANANVPNMLGQISTTMARGQLNIHNMVNKSRGDMAYTLVDVDSAVPDHVLDELRGIPGVLVAQHMVVLGLAHALQLGLKIDVARKRVAADFSAIAGRAFHVHRAAALQSTQGGQRQRLLHHVEAGLVGAGQGGDGQAHAIDRHAGADLQPDGEAWGKVQNEAAQPGAVEKLRHRGD